MLSRKWHVVLGVPLLVALWLGFRVLAPHQEGRDFSEADLHGSRWAGYHLHGADLYHADLSGADLRGADLSLATLCGTNLRHANLSGANLTMAKLSGADLTGACLDNVHMDDTVHDLTTRWPDGFRLPPRKPLQQRLVEMEQRRRAWRARRRIRSYRGGYFRVPPPETTRSTPPARLAEQ